MYHGLQVGSATVRHSQCETKLAAKMLHSFPDRICGTVFEHDTAEQEDKCSKNGIDTSAREAVFVQDEG